MSELDKVNQIGSVSSTDKTEVSGEYLKLSQKIDFEKYPNLKNIRPEDLEALVTDKDGKLLPEEGLKAADKIALEQNADGIKKANDEDLKEMQDLKLYNLFVKGKINPEALHEKIHNLDGTLKSETELKKLDEDINNQGIADFNKQKDEAFLNNLEIANEKSAAVKEETNAANEELKEAMGAEEFDKMQAQAEVDKESLFSTKDAEKEKDLSTDEARREFADDQNLKGYNETVTDDKSKLDKQDDADAIGDKYFKLKDQLKALDKIKESVEETKKTKAEQEKAAQASASAQAGGSAQGAQAAEPNAEAMNADKTKDYVNTNPENKAETGLYKLNNDKLTAQIGHEFKTNDQVVNINNDKYFNKKQNEAMQAIYDKLKDSPIENGEEDINNPMTLLAGMEGGPKNLKELQEKLKQSQENNGAGNNNSPLSALSNEAKFNPFKKTSGAESAISINDIGASESEEESSSELQFDKKAASSDKIDDEITAMDDQATEEDEALGVKKDEEEQKLKDMEKGAEAAEKATDTAVNKLLPNAQAAEIDGSKWVAANKAKEEAAGKIAAITAQNIGTQAAFTASERNNATNKGLESQALSAAAAVAAAIPGGAGTAAYLAAAAQVAQFASNAFDKSSNDSKGAGDQLAAQKKAAEAQQAQIAAVNHDLAQKQAEGQAEEVKAMTAMVNAFRADQAKLNANIKTQAGQVAKVTETQVQKKEAFAADKDLLKQKKEAAANSKNDESKPAAENKEVKSETAQAAENKETKEGAVADAGSKTDQSKEAKSGDGIFEFKENENIKKDDLKAKFANQLMDDGKDEKQGMQVGAVASVLGGNKAIGLNNAVNEKEESKNEDGTSTIQFKAYSKDKEKRITKEVLGVEDNGIAKAEPEKQAKKPVLRMASRFAQTANKVNGVDGTAAKGFTA